MLNLKVKDINKPNKKYVIICNKPWELATDSYKTLKFWLQFNQMIGIDIKLTF